ncbi:related to peroxisome assembly protein PAS10 [Rhynchosporium secalis]|uniref:Peroxisome assembly protein 12 n=1 Tax=Rhynchosporium secalis TaxID=38038 RepID=A0A1E1LUL9_RHYSE|nr:related to peroxisome assembly protein PAS10 [Rhynchosporium secalis]
MEFMTALHSTFDDHKPSLFELLSEAQLASLLPPSLRYLLAVATHRNPRYLLRILNSFNEIYALLMLLVERHYLLTHSGSFTENFYGLKREKALSVGEIPRANIAAPSHVREALILSKADIWKNLAVLVGLPYLKRKLDESYDINAPRALLGASYTRMPANPTLKQRFLHYYRWFLRHVYPSVNAAYYFSMLAFNIAYLFDNSKYHSPFMWLIGTRMRRLGEADYRAIAALSEPKSSVRQGPAGGNLGVTSLFSPRVVGERALDSLKFLLPTSIFALKFLEWWHASDFARQLSKKAAEGIEVPPPIVSGLSSLSARFGPKGEKQGTSTPAKDGDEKEGEAEDTKEEVEAEKPPVAATSLLPIYTVPAPQDSENCPICQQEITTATACQTGFVFCYTWERGEVGGWEGKVCCYWEEGVGWYRRAEEGDDMKRYLHAKKINNHKSPSLDKGYLVSDELKGAWNSDLFIIIVDMALFRDLNKG